MALQAQALDQCTKLTALQKLSLAADANRWDATNTPRGDTSTTSATSTRHTSETAWSQTVLLLRQRKQAQAQTPALRSVIRQGEARDKKAGLRVILKEPDQQTDDSPSRLSTARPRPPLACCCCGPDHAALRGQREMAVASAPTRRISAPEMPTSSSPVPRRDRRVSIPSGPAHLLEQMLPPQWRKKTITAATNQQSSSEEDQKSTPRPPALSKAETVREHASSASYFLSRFESLSPRAAKGMVAAPPKLSVWAIRAAAKADLNTASLLHTRAQLSRNGSNVALDCVSDQSIFSSSSREPLASPAPISHQKRVISADAPASEDSAPSSTRLHASFIPSPATRAESAGKPKSRSTVPTISALMPSLPRNRRSEVRQKKPLRDLPQHRRDSVEEFMQEIPSLSSIGVTSSATEAPAVRASLFLSSVTTLAPSMESDLQIPNEMPTIFLPPRTGFRDGRECPTAGRRVSFSSTAMAESHATSAVIGSELIPLVDLVSHGGTRLREPQSRRTMVARMRFDKAVPCEMVALLPDGKLKLLSGFHLRVQSNTGDTVITKRLQKKIYKLSSLSYIDASKSCLATARGATINDAQSSNPEMWDQVDIEQLQIRETSLCLYSQGKSLPCMPVFEVPDDKHDFLELLALNAQTNLPPKAAASLTILL